MGSIPVEIFDIILSHLSRSDARTLRLVCREFEEKVSSHYFRNVVVPFKAELYSRHDDGVTGLKPHGFSSGIRIFQSFGPHILRFALSLELDEDVLAFPPPKLMQQAVPTFWGIYRWPNHHYCRYRHLENIERTADETADMAAALRCLSKVRNLGLCCDAGLGFLLGPDRVARRALAPGPVFAAEDWRRKRELPAPMPPRPVVAITNGTAAAHDTPQDAAIRYFNAKNNTLAEMVAAAGFTDPGQVREAIRLLIETERTSLDRIELESRRDANPYPEEQLMLAATWSSLPASYQQCHLTPSCLTVAQLEMLVELEWAHRAMIQSYIIGLMDNASCGLFANMTTLSIAKIPSSHVQIFCRHDLWNSLSQIKSVSVGVIADWRRISVPSTGFIDERPISPLRAVAQVFKLLNGYIGQQPNIESVHFEWICGGELAPSSFQRNMYVLPAPFFERPELMAVISSPIHNADDLLCLPHVMHLSLKNCWVSPHVMLQELRQLALSSLEKLELESVSLSGPPTMVPQFAVSLFAHHRFLNQHVQSSDMAAFYIAHSHGLMLPAPLHLPDGDWAAVHLPPAEAFNDPPDPAATADLAEPDIMKWSGIIEYFCPGVGAGELQNPGAADPLDGYHDEFSDPGLLPFLPSDTLRRPDGECYQLRSLSFKSCGYAALDLPHIDTRSILPDALPTTPSPTIGPRFELNGRMQWSSDKLLAITIPFITPRDLTELTSKFRMSLGWDGVYDERVKHDAMSDGIAIPGQGRFSGIVEGDNDFSTS